LLYVRNISFRNRISGPNLEWRVYPNAHKPIAIKSIPGYFTIHALLPILQNASYIPIKLRDIPLDS
jgi:hypothetical protein